MSNGGEDTASWRICRPEEGPPYFFNIQSGTTVWSLPDGLRLEDVPEFGVEDEVYDPTNTGSSSSSSSSSDDSGSSSSDDEEQADDGADAGASDGAVERAPVPQSVKPLLPPGAPLAMVAEGSDDSDDASDSGSAVAAVAAGAGAGAGAGAAVNGDDGVDTDESGEDDFHESKWDLPLGSTVCSLSLPKARWEKRLDTGSGETYFIDIETGETEWDTPDDYEDPDAFDVDDSLSLADMLQDMGLQAHSNARGDTCSMRDAVKKGGVDATRLHQRLARLLKLLQVFGTEEEWETAVRADDFWLPQFVLSCWSTCTPSETNVLTAKLLVLFGNLAPDMTSALVTGVWCPLRDLIEGVAKALTAVVSDNDTSSESCLPWLLLLQAMYSCIHTRLDESDDDSLARKPIVSCREDLGGLDIADLLISISASTDDGSKLCAAVTAARMFALEEMSDIKPSTWLSALAVHQHTQQMGSAVIALLNTLSYPYGDERSVFATLDFIQLMSMVRLRPTQPNSRMSILATAPQFLFFTTDLKVLVDVVLREIEDLPPEHRVRASFVNVLGVLMLRSQWATEASMYRAADIGASLEALVDDDAMERLHPDVVEAANSVLDMCGDLLE